MKRVIHLIALSLVFSLAFSSCKKDNSTSADVDDVLENDSWRVSLFDEDGNNETHHFTDYTFVFNDGSVTATNGSNTETGTYSRGSDNSTEKFILDFGSGDPFEELNEDWRVLEKTNVKIRLQHISGGNGGTDLLTFERN